MSVTRTYLCQILDLRSMDWSNRFTLGGFTVTYSTFQMAWEVVEKQGDYELAYCWFYSQQRAEDICLGRIKRK